MLFFGVLHVCSCKCGTRVSGHAREAAQRLQMVCTEYEVKFHFGRFFFSSKLSLWCFYGLTFAMILDYYIHNDIL